MSRAGIAAVVGIALLLAGCSGGGSASHPYGKAPACPLLAELARTGQTVERADVSDPDAFDTTMRTAVDQYVQTATKLRGAVPQQLKRDVQRMISAVRRQHFAEAVSARSSIDEYARANCKTTT